MKTCHVPGCTLNNYAKGLCRKHYNRNIRSGSPVLLRDIREEVLNHSGCSVLGCVEKAKIITRNNIVYCTFHHLRLSTNLQRPINSPKGASGPLNGNWRGGVAQYPNHYAFKKARLRVLIKYNYQCLRCGLPAKTVHHKDNTNYNHSDDNLEPLCNKCHHLTMKKRTSITSKFIRLYGETVISLSSKIGVSTGTIYNWHKSGVLKTIIAQFGNLDKYNFRKAVINLSKNKGCEVDAEYY
jgi:5-methylcytosine-specific restriction endonuclease McrA